MDKPWGPPLVVDVHYVRVDRSPLGYRSSLTSSFRYDGIDFDQFLPEAVDYRRVLVHFSVVLTPGMGVIIGMPGFFDWHLTQLIANDVVQHPLCPPDKWKLEVEILPGNLGYAL